MILIISNIIWIIKLRKSKDENNGWNSYFNCNLFFNLMIKNVTFIICVLEKNEKLRWVKMVSVTHLGLRQ